MGSIPGSGRSPGGATHSSILAWKIPRTEEPGRLQSMGSQRIGHDWRTEHTLPETSIIQGLYAYSFISFSQQPYERVKTRLYFVPFYR